MQGTVVEARTIYGTSASTIFNIWKRFRESCDDRGIGGAHHQNYSKNGKKHGRQKKDQGNLLDRIKIIPDNKRQTMTAGY